MNVLIVDDELNACEILSRMITRLWPDYNQLEFAHGVSTARERIKNNKVDILFLDIQMNDGTGFDLLESLESINFDVIFTTAFDEYALKAFKYSATDYLLKPISISDLKDSLNRLSQRKMKEMHPFLRSIYSSGDFSRINIPGLSENKIVNVDQILYCQSDNNYTWFYMRDGNKVLSSKTLKTYEEMLPNNVFFRSHQSYLINLLHFQSFDKKINLITLTSGEELPVSLRKKTELNKILKKGIGEY